MKRIIYQIEIEESVVNNQPKMYLTIGRGKLKETYPINATVFAKVTGFITRNLKAQFEVWGVKF